MPPSPERVPPHDLGAEECVLGAGLLSRKALEHAVNHLTPTDFYSPKHTQIFTAESYLYEHGEAVDAVTVAAMLDKMGVLDLAGGAAALIAIQSNVPAISHIQAYATVIKTHSDARRALKDLVEATSQIYALEDPYAVTEGLSMALDGIGRVGAPPRRFWPSIDDYLDRPGDDLGHWVIPGMCRSDSRIVVIATEGGGKSVCLRQIAYCASQGVHPFRLTKILRRRVMVLDLENNDWELTLSGRQARSMCQNTLPRWGDSWDPTYHSLFSRPFGFDLRNQRDRSDLETAIENFRPDLIIGGPIYKMMPAREGESDPRHADAFQQIVGKLMERHGFALIIEHHAPAAQHGQRELRGIGGQRWAAWPDVIIALEMETDAEKEATGNFQVKVKKSRGVFDWPKKLERGGSSLQWPWIATYAGREDDSAPPLDEPEDEELF